jgi:hypothetical protein
MHPDVQQYLHNIEKLLLHRHNLCLYHHLMAVKKVARFISHETSMDAAAAAFHT